MADASDGTLNLEIKIGVDGQGGEKAKQILDETAKGAEDLAKQMGVITVSGDEAAKIIGKGGEKAEMSHLSMRRLANAMGSEIPGGAALMESAFAGAEDKMMGATFLLIAGIEMLKASIEHLNKERADAKKISDALADADARHSEIIDKEREALERAEVSEAEFFHNYTRNAHDAIEAAEKLADAIRKTAFSNAQGKDDKQHGIAEKEIDDMERRGVISHEAAEQAKEQIDIQFEQRKLERMMANDKAEEVAAEAKMMAKQVAAHNDLGAEKTAEGAYETAAQAKAKNDQKTEEAKARIAAGEDTKKSLREKGVDDESVQRLMEWTRKQGGDDSTPLENQYKTAADANLKNIELVGPLAAKLLPAGKLVSQFGEYGDQNLATYEGANLDIKAGKSDIGRAQKASLGLDINEGNAKSDLDYARGRAEKDRDAAADAGDQFQTLKATNSIKEQGARTDFGLDAAAAALHGHATNISNFMAQVNRLAAAMSKMTPANVTALEARISAIESQQAAHTGQISNSYNTQTGG